MSKSYEDLETLLNFLPTHTLPDHMGYDVYQVPEIAYKQ